jgi:hypothetical protein
MIEKNLSIENDRDIDAVKNFFDLVFQISLFESIHKFNKMHMSICVFNHYIFYE